MVLFFAHIPFVVSRAFSATPEERLQQYACQSLVSLNTTIYCEKLEEISDLMIFPEYFRGSLKTLWRATCGPRAANCPPLI